MLILKIANDRISLVFILPHFLFVPRSKFLRYVIGRLHALSHFNSFQFHIPIQQKRRIFSCPSIFPAGSKVPVIKVTSFTRPFLLVSSCLTRCGFIPISFSQFSFTSKSNVTCISARLFAAFPTLNYYVNVFPFSMSSYQTK